jgi:hypothetical protein
LDAFFSVYAEIPAWPINNGYAGIRNLVESGLKLEGIDSPPFGGTDGQEVKSDRFWLTK